MVLIQLTETDKRIIFCLFLLIILIFVLVGWLGYVITRVMKRQGTKIDTKVYDVVTTRVISDKKSFKTFARKKSMRIFYKAARIPMLIMLISGFCILLHYLINGFDVSLFDIDKGFSTILFVWDFDNTPYTNFFGINIISGWAPLLEREVDGVIEQIGMPRFVWAALPSYLGVLGMGTGLLWYFYVVQAYIARALRISKLCDSIFEKSLEGFNINNQNLAQLNPQAQQNQQAPQSPIPPNNRNINI